MKRTTIMISLIVMSIFHALAQTQEYKNLSAGLSYTYPSNFQKQAINNASHMLLKLENGNITLTLSRWEYNIPPAYTIWEDEIVQLTRENIRRAGISLISMDKRYLKLQSGQEKCLVSITYSSSQNMHMITYQFLRNGSLIQIVVYNKGKYIESKLEQYDKLAHGLKLKK